MLTPQQLEIISDEYYLKVGGIQEKIDFLNPQPNCRFGASMLLWRRN
jgi:hypothetical protein